MIKTKERGQQKTKATPKSTSNEVLIMASKQQTKLIKHWRSLGYFVINLVKITPTGLPDLIALKPNEVIFIESKEVWDKLSALQIAKIEILKKLKFKVYVNENEY